MRKYLTMVALLAMFIVGCEQVKKEPNVVRYEYVVEPYTGPTKPVIRIRAYESISDNQRRYHCGSGFFINHNTKTYLITAYHVLNGTIMTEFYTYDSKPIRVDLGGSLRFPNEDIIMMEVLSVSAQVVPYELGSYKISDSVKSIGYPMNGDYTEENGLNHNSCAETTAQIVVGMSGGPVLNSKGKVIGVNSATVQGDPNVKGLFSRLDDIFRTLNGGSDNK